MFVWFPLLDMAHCISWLRRRRRWEGHTKRKRRKKKLQPWDSVVNMARGGMKRGGRPSFSFIWVSSFLKKGFFLFFSDPSVRACGEMLRVTPFCVSGVLPCKKKPACGKWLVVKRESWKCIFSEVPYHAHCPFSPTKIFENQDSLRSSLGR